MAAATRVVKSPIVASPTPVQQHSVEGRTDSERRAVAPVTVSTAA
jgi:hypothetical protein